MICSMTGFAAIEREIADGILVIELRSVNHRYLELQLKLDDQLRIFEPLIRELIAAKLGRGKVECRMSLIQRLDSGEKSQLNHTALQRLKQLASDVQEHFPQSQPLRVAEILHWPGVLNQQGGNQEMLSHEIRTGLQQILQDMSDARAREGARLKTLILERLTGVEQIVARVKPLLSPQIQAYEERLRAKLQEAVVTLSDERLSQEITLFMQRVDVDEELTRLSAHVEEVRRILDEDTAVGKRLDFLMQELNREANTLGSKSVSIEVSRASMELKVLIEQMREQIQNIE
ncbi:MAG TPA: YicC/YloC family endoribonuclease [Methylophilaceae bacterium]|nr:YicC/YloC family endoribonuclease [Methylophilaceae bacterium]HZV61669.1 YicC/YloC family endoribonuclease [Methylophilaceae bacterium]